MPVVADSSLEPRRRDVVTYRKSAAKLTCTFVLGKDSRGLPTDRRMTVPDLSQGGQVAERYEATKWAVTITDFLLRRSIISY
jgi:hypothetical protein